MKKLTALIGIILITSSVFANNCPTTSEVKGCTLSLNKDESFGFYSINAFSGPESCRVRCAKYLEQYYSDRDNRVEDLQGKEVYCNFGGLTVKSFDAYHQEELYSQYR